MSNGRLAIRPAGKLARDRSSDMKLRIKNTFDARTMFSSGHGSAGHLANGLVGWSMQEVRS
jgi:hypothetical protein